MALFVCCLTVENRFFSILLWRNANINLLISNHFPNLVTVITSVCNKGFCVRQIRQKNISALEITALSLCQMKPDRPTNRIAKRVQFGIHAPFGSANQAWFGPPFLRLDAVRWALRWVASIISVSASVPLGLASSLNISSKIPLRDQRIKRIYHG